MDIMTSTIRWVQTNHVFCSLRYCPTCRFHVCRNVNSPVANGNRSWNRIKPEGPSSTTSPIRVGLYVH